MVLGRSWGVSMRSWEGLGTTLKNIVFQSCVCMSLGVCATCVFVRVGAVLGGSWGDLGRFGLVLGGRPGGIFIDFLLVFLVFRENRRFRC